MKMENRQVFLYGTLLLVLGFLIWLIVMETASRRLFQAELSHHDNPNTSSSNLEQKTRMDVLEAKLHTALSQLESFEKRYSMMTTNFERVEATSSGNTAKCNQLRESQHQHDLSLLLLDHKINVTLTSALTSLHQSQTINLEKTDDKWTSALEKHQKEMQTAVQKLDVKLSEAVATTKANFQIVETQIEKLEQQVIDILRNLTIDANRTLTQLEENQKWKAKMDSRNLEINTIVDNLQSQIFTLEVSINNSLQHYKNRIAPLEGRIVSVLKKQGELETRVSISIQQVNNWTSTVITDVRLMAPERTTIDDDQGFFDESGYVITEVSDPDGDNVVDQVSRRLFQKRVNGSWINI